MQKRQLFITGLLILLPVAVSVAIERQEAQAFVGQDLHLAGQELISYQLSTGEHSLVFRDGFSMSIGANQFSSNSAVVWLKSVTSEFRGRVRIDYEARVYLQGKVSAKKGKVAKTTKLHRTVVAKDGSMFVRFNVSGEVFVTAAKREIADPRGLELYKKAVKAEVPAEPLFVVQPEALVPELPTEKRPLQKVWTRKGMAAAKPKEPELIEPGKRVVTAKPGKPGFVEEVVAREEAAKLARAAAKPEEKEPLFSYPVNIAPAGEEPLKFDSAPAPDGTDIVTIIGRVYVWQRQEKGGLLELQADNAVMFYSSKELQTGDEQMGAEDILPKGGAIKAVYMSGDVVVTKGQRTIRADEIYYDFQRKKSLAINAVMRNFDADRGIPIYVRAAKLHQIAENKFTAEDITLTSSEFYQPQISFTASDIVVTDTTPDDEQEGKVSDSSYDAQMRNVRLKMGKRTIFYWPFVRSNLERPDIPLKSVSVGHDSIWGTSVETRWYLSRLLGLREPEGVDSTLLVDYFSKRGVGIGTEIDYERENYFGNILGYIIKDSGEDRLGRHRSRRHLEPDNELRGRFSWQHRQFLPHKWQLTAGVDYSSDEHFVEQYYRNEFNTGNRQETYIHLKRIEENRAISILGKGRINDFADELEEMPSAEFHLTGQSLFDDKFTLYSDTQGGRFRQRIGDDHSILMKQEHFSFVSHRTELDMPVKAGALKIVPFVAGTFGYDDRSGFRRTLVDGSNTGSFGEDKVWLGEAGVRVFPRPYWKVYPNVKSRLWNLNQLRHIVKPRLTAVLYGESDSVVKQRDTLNIGLSQRLQTKRIRGAGDGTRGTKYETVDWMRLDTDVTFVSDSEKASTSGPDRFIWAKPIVPLRVFSAPQIFNGDLIGQLHRFEMFGPRRNYFGADYLWRVSDTSAILSDMNFDMQSGVVQQFNIGFSRLCWPNLSYYIGSRYLRRVEVLDEKGSNAFTFAATYVLDPRYTVVFAQQFDFDYGANIRSDITIIRRYHRMYCSITFSVDDSLDRQAIVFSIWPQGVPEMALGKKRYMHLGGAARY